MWQFYLFAFLLCLFVGYACYCVGAITARREIADAIRAGRLNLLQRIDHVAAQIESGIYRPVGDP